MEEVCHIQVSFTGLDEPSKGILLVFLEELGYDGFWEEGAFFSAYIKEDSFDEGSLKSLVADRGWNYTLEKILSRNWNQEWESNFKPVSVGHFCRIRAHFHEPSSEAEHEIVITPKMSFGTGHHATTFLMIQAMQELEFKGKSVLDFGTGTGILAILADKLGAQSVTACDHDGWSLENAAENIQANACQNILLTGADISSVSLEFDLILANINMNVLIEHMEILSRLLKPAGMMLMSGILQSDLGELERNLTIHKLMINKFLDKNQWALAVVKRTNY